MSPSTNIDFQYLEEKIANIYEKCKKDQYGRVLLRDIMQMNPNMKISPNDNLEKSVNLNELMNHAKTYFCEKSKSPRQSSSSDFDPYYLKDSETSYDCFSVEFVGSSLESIKYKFMDLFKKLKDDLVDIERIMYNSMDEFATVYETIIKNIEFEIVKFQNITETCRRKMANYQGMLEDHQAIMLLNEQEDKENADVLESLKNDKKFMMGRIANLEIFNETLDQQNKTFEERLQFYEHKISQLEEDNTRLERNNEYLQLSLNKMELNIVSLESKEETLQESLYYHKIQEQNLKEELGNYKQGVSNEFSMENKPNELDSLTFYCKALLKVILEKAPELLNKEFLYN